MADNITLSARELTGASLCQTLHWLAAESTRSETLTGHYLDAIARANPRLNAYLHVDAEGALAAARASDERRRNNRLLGRLDGVPIAVKDNLDVAGMPTTAGLAFRRGRLAESDAHAVARLRAAGAVLLGKTNLDEGALGTTCANPHYGVCHNPLRQGYTPGGSSGGSAVAVAAGLCAAAIGSDSMGSLRIPASYCGVFALKPTPGEISTSGLVPVARRLDSIGPLARSVDDLTVLLTVLAGHDPGDPRSRRRRVALALPDWEPSRLRVGLLSDPVRLGIDAEVVGLFNSAIAQLKLELGHCLAVDFSDYDFARMRRAGLLMMEAEMRVEHAAALASQPEKFSAELLAMLDYARGKAAADFVAADRQMDQAVLKARLLFAEVDVLMTPTTPQAAFAFGTPVPANQADITSFANLSGCPAVSIPMGALSNGLPVGMQFIGPPGSDLRLLELAGVCAATLDAAPRFPLAE